MYGVMRLATNPIHDFIHVLWARPLKTKGNGRTSGERHDRKIDTLANSPASAVPSGVLRMRRWRQLYSGPKLDLIVAPLNERPLPFHYRSHLLYKFLFISSIFIYIYIYKIKNVRFHVFSILFDFKFIDII